MNRIWSISVALLAFGCSKASHWQDQPREKREGNIAGHRYSIELPKAVKVEANDPHTRDRYAYGTGGTVAVQVDITWSTQRKSKAEMITFEQNKVLSTPKPAPQQPLLTAGDDQNWAFVMPDASNPTEYQVVRGQRVTADGALLCEAQVYQRVGAGAEQHALSLCGSLLSLEPTGR